MPGGARHKLRIKATSIKPQRRRCLLLSAGVAALSAVSRIARAQAYTAYPVRIDAGTTLTSPSIDYRDPSMRPTHRKRRASGFREP
jgi:hypothetical protein